MMYIKAQEEETTTPSPDAGVDSEEVEETTTPTPGAGEGSQEIEGTEGDEIESSDEE